MVAVENKIETRACYRCKVEMPLTPEFFRPSGKTTFERSCKKCAYDNNRFRQAVNDVKKRIYDELREAPKNVVFKLLDSDPALYKIIAERIGELEFRRLLLEERKRIITEHKKSSDKWLKDHPGVRAKMRLDREKVWATAMAELLASKKKKVKR